MRISVKKLAFMAALLAAALIIFVIEAQIPIPLPIPGVKLGLANVITLVALFSNASKENPERRLSTSEVLLILLCRIILGAVFTGRVTAFLYSLTGGLFSFAVMVFIRKIVTIKQIWVCGAIGAVFHNIGQILAAMLITSTPSIALYLPALIIAGIVTGVFTGFAAQFAVQRLTGKG